MSGQTPVFDALGKQLLKIMFPAVDGGAPYTEKAFELFQGAVRIAALSEGSDDKQHRGPIYPALPKPDGWRKDTAPAAFTTAAQAITNSKYLIQIRRTAPRLSRIIGIVQRPSAVGQRWDRTCSAISKSILRRRENNELRLRISGGIIGPAIYG